MARVLTAAALLFSIATNSASADEIPETIQNVADEAGVDSVDLAGAVATTGLDPWVYLCQADGIGCPKEGSRLYVRMTYYTYNSGITASGGRVYNGSTACSFNFPFGTEFRLSDGSIVTCNDRGLLYFDPRVFAGWLDIYNRPDMGRAGAGWVTRLN